MNNNIPSSEFIIRPASFNDIKFIQQIVAETWPQTYTSILGKEQVDYMIEKLYSTPSLEDQMKKGHYFFLALNNYSAVGFASFSHEEGLTYKLQKLYVLPNHQKSGIGKKLLKTIETVARSMGGKVLELNVNRNNNAKGFYEKRGFAILEEENIDIGNGYFMNDYVMTLNL